MDYTYIKRARRWDRIARYVITAGGGLIIISVIGILVLIAAVALPLFLPTSIDEQRSFTVQTGVPTGRVVAMGCDDYLKIAFRMADDGTVVWQRLDDGRVFDRDRIQPPGAPDATITVARRSGATTWTLIWSDGSVSAEYFDMKIDSQRPAGARNDYERVLEAPIAEGEQAPVAVSVVEYLGGPTRTQVWQMPDNTLTVKFEKGHREHRMDVLNPEDLPITWEGNEFRIDGFSTPISTFTVARDCKLLYVALQGGDLLRYDLDKNGATLVESLNPLPEGTTITALGVNKSDLSVVVGDSGGGVNTWSLVPFPGIELMHEMLAERGVTHSTVRYGGEDIEQPLEELEGGNLTDAFKAAVAEVDRTQWVDGIDGTDHRFRVELPLPGLQLRITHPLKSHDGAITSVSTSYRRHGVWTVDASGTLHYDYVISDRHLGHVSDHAHFGVSPSDLGLVALAADGTLNVFAVNAPHPEVSFNTLFGRVWYEGGDFTEPQFAWQSDSEIKKLSLVPLIFGTLKGTFYAMLFAVPLAIFGAMYTSQFLHPRMQAIVKPSVEIMAAIPSVVIGFLAALWFAPIVNSGVLTWLLLLLLLPFGILGTTMLWQRIASLDAAQSIRFVQKRGRGAEYLVLIPSVAFTYLVASLIGPLIESILFSGDFTQWLFNDLGTKYEQRNCIIIAFGLGFAVVPIIFTITEDAISNVPRSLAAGSLALGATRWQTAWRVVLPSASPGIFAATMIGLGRAIGETMIVLMAFGNTAIIDASPFNGARTLSANIAVEVPEAPEGGTLYRVLFLSAVILFVITSVLNTAAEIVRQRLRNKFGRH